MALTTLALVKNHLGITDTSEDTALTQWLAAAVDLVRKLKGQWIGGIISANTLANPTVCTSIGHGLESGDLIYIRGSNSTPTIDGERTVTKLTRDTFSVPVNVTVAGTAGGYSRVMTEYYGGDGSNELWLRQRPVQSVSAVYEDPSGYFGVPSDAFAASTLLTAGTDYVLYRDTPTTRTEVSLRGLLVRLGSVWPSASSRRSGNIVPDLVDGSGNIKVTSTIGYVTVPEEVQLATHIVVALMRRTAKLGAPVISERLDYYQYQLGNAEDVKQDVLQVKSLLGIGKEWVW